MTMVQHTDLKRLEYYGFKKESYMLERYLLNGKKQDAFLLDF